MRTILALLSGLSPPTAFAPDFMLLLQTLSMMEAAAVKLDPGYDIFTVSAPYVRRIQRKSWLWLLWRVIRSD